MPKTVTSWNKRYEMIERSCREQYHCDPCTYPNCQRSSRLTKAASKAFGRI